MKAVETGTDGQSAGELDVPAILASLPGANVVFAADAPHFTVLAVSDAGLAATGRTRDAVVGRSLEEAFPPESGDAGAKSLASLSTSLAAAVRTGVPQRLPRQRYDLQRADGTWEVRYWDAINTPVPGPGGVVRCVFHQTQDVTAAVRADEVAANAEAALRESEARFRLMADTVPQIVWVTDPDGRVEFFNAQWTAYTGAPYEPATAADVAASFVHPDDGAMTIAAFEEARRTAGVFSVEHRIRSASGEYRWFIVRAEAYRRPDTGEVMRWFGASVDIHDRRLAETALRASEARLQLAVAATGIGFFDWDLVTDQVSVNARFREMLGQPPGGEVIGAAMLGGVVHPEDREVVSARIGVALDPDSGGRYEFEHRVVTPAGERRLLTIGQVYFQGEGQERRAVRVFGVDLDVTERTRTAAARERLLEDAQAARRDAEAARSEAEAANRAKSEFLAVMSHELRTPLNAIAGYAELIELGIRGPVTPQQREDLARIQKSQRHLLGLINGVLNYSRAEAGAVHYEVNDVPLDAVLATCETLIAPQARAKGIALEIRSCSAVLSARADPEKLQQIVVNLLSNGVKFTADEGRVTVICGREEQPAEGPRVVIKVLDTGRGIAADALERVFEPFVQVDTRLTRTGEGIGLGLAISRDLARGMGGDLTAESVPGVGSTFTLTLPAS